MGKKFLLPLSAVLFVGTSFGVHYDPIPPKEYHKLLGVGINVNWATFRWLEKTYWKYREMDITIPSYFADRGFSTVRIRVRDIPPHQEVKELGITYGEYVKTLINDSLDAGLIPVVTLTAEKFRKNPNGETLDYTVKVWERWAEYLKDTPYEVSYDLIIETSGRISRKYDILNEFYQKVVPAIRRIDPHRILFLTPPVISRPYYLKYLKLPENDPYVMVEWHFFAAGPSPKNKPKKWTTGTPAERENVLNQIKYARQWCDAHHVYCWVGAWMPSNWNKVNRKAKYPDGSPGGGSYSREQIYEFSRFMAKSLKEYGFPYAINADTKFFDYKRLEWYPSLERILDVVINPY